MYQQQIVTRLVELQDQVEQKFGRRPIINSVLFNLRGKAAGQATARGVIRFNPLFAQHYTERFLARTVPHELAHVAAYQMFGTMAHDNNWRRVMYNLGVEPTRCHEYDLSVIPGYAYSYACPSCKRQYKLSRTRHNRVLSGTQYSCGVCRTPIEAA